MPEEPCCLKLWFAFSHQLVQLTGPCIYSPRTSTELVGIGIIPVCQVEAGVLKPGKSGHLCSSQCHNSSKSIEIHHEALSEALAGDDVAFCVRKTCQRCSSCQCDWWQQKWPTSRRSWLHGLGEYPDPSRPDKCWIRTCADLSPSSHLLGVCWAEDDWSPF